MKIALTLGNAEEREGLGQVGVGVAHEHGLVACTEQGGLGVLHKGFQMGNPHYKKEKSEDKGNGGETCPRLEVLFEST